MRAIAEIYPSFNPGPKITTFTPQYPGEYIFCNKCTKWCNGTHRMTVKREKSIWCAILIMVSVNHMLKSSDTSGDSPQLADSRHQKKRMWRPPLQWSGMCIWPISPFHVSPQLSNKIPPPSQHTYEQKRMRTWKAGVNELNSPWHPSDPCTHPT